MSTVLAEPTWTIEEMESLPDSDRYELVCGKLREREVSQLSDAVGQQLLIEIGLFLGRNSPVLVNGPGTGYLTGRPDIQVPRPDGSVTLKSRLPGGHPSRGHATTAPDLAFEVVSANEDAAYLQKKVEVYLAIGVRLVWVIYPEQRTVLVFRQNGTVARLREPQRLSGEDVLPGFECELSTFLPEDEQDDETSA